MTHDSTDAGRQAAESMRKEIDALKRHRDEEARKHAKEQAGDHPHRRRTDQKQAQAGQRVAQNLPYAIDALKRQRTREALYHATHNRTDLDWDWACTLLPSAGSSARQHGDHVVENQQRVDQAAGV